MTYDAREISTDLGQPVELYTFTRGTLTWRYTSADRDVTVASNLYSAQPILRGNVEQGSELNRSGLTLTVRRDNAVADQYRISPPSDLIALTVQQYHFSDAELIVVWSGRIISVSFAEATAEIHLEPIYNAVRRIGLRRIYQKQCPHVLYGAQCGVNKDTLKLATTVSALSGLTVTATGLSAFADGYWEGGYIEWLVSAGIYERRFILNHTGSTIDLDTIPQGLAVSTAINVYPGCDHSTGAGGCARFSNILNFGGMPYIPLKNPYGNDPIY